VETLNTDPEYKSVCQEFIERFNQLQSLYPDRNEKEIFNETADQLISQGVLQINRSPPRRIQSIQTKPMDSSIEQPTQKTVDLDKLFKE